MNNDKQSSTLLWLPQQYTIAFMKKNESKRLSPELRKAKILEAAKIMLSRDGLEKFSLEGVAREAGVAASLPRHYFHSHAELLMSAASEALLEAQMALINPDLSITLPQRLSHFLDVVAKHPWAFSTYLRADDIHPSLGAAARHARRRIAEFSFLRPWDRMTLQEKIHARGWVGYIEGITGEWIEGGMADRDIFLQTMLNGARGLKVKGLAE
jgi:AcrR family transcriptional regulator